MTTGDRVWWTWDGQAVADVGEGLLLLEEDKVLNPLANKNTSTDQSGMFASDHILLSFVLFFSF